MSTKKDKSIISKLGGSAKVAALLGFYDEDYSGFRRVNNWTRRGIPKSIRKKWPELFGPLDSGKIK